MRKRTPEQQKLNSAYQSRFRRCKFVVDNFSEEERKALCDRINQSEEVD